MPSNTEVKEFYDAFTGYELKSGVNLRHLHLFNSIVATGLRRHHHILEIGCGIGQLTGLLHQYLRKGEIMAVDISPQSVEIARKRIGSSNRIQFAVSDMTAFEPGKTFDYIILPDVLEHIPLENHFALFGLLSKCMHATSQIIIHIPHPDLIENDRLHQPEILQIIDQPIPADLMMKNAYAHDLQLVEYKSYSLFHETPDYIFIHFRKNILPAYPKYSKMKIIFKKSKARIVRLSTILFG